jgi:hypothetical protein
MVSQENFTTPGQLSQSHPPALLVTIDTEEEGLWRGSYRKSGNTVANLRGIPWFQTLCDSLEILPTYLVDSPVVADPDGSDLLRAYQQEGRAEVGAHLHPWCTAPFEEEVCPRNSWLQNLPQDLQRRKLQTLTDEITRVFGRPPTSFRAGRYGLGTFAATVLAEMGYLVDSSVIPFTNYSGQAGPDYSAADWKPYRVSPANLLAADPAGRLLELPVSVGFNSNDFQRTWSRHRRFATGLPRHLKLNGVLDRLRIGQRIKLSPEQASTGEMQTLIRRSLRQGAECLVLMFHSSSLVEGLSPYVSDSERFEQFRQRLTEILTYWRRTLGFPAPTMSEFASSWMLRNPSGIAISP